MNGRASCATDAQNAPRFDPSWSPDVFVLEADESDGSFLLLNPVIAIITNIDAEHLDHFKTFDAIKDASDSGREATFG